MSTTKYVNTSYELKLLSHLNGMVGKKVSQSEIDEVKERLVDYLIKTLAYLDMLRDRNKHKEILEGENIKLLEVLCTVETPKIKRTYSEPIKVKDGESRIIWLTVEIGEGESKSSKRYGIETFLHNGEKKEVFTDIRLEYFEDDYDDYDE